VEEAAPDFLEKCIGLFGQIFYCDILLDKSIEDHGKQTGLDFLRTWRINKIHKNCDKILDKTEKVRNGSGYSKIHHIFMVYYAVQNCLPDSAVNGNVPIC